MSIKLTFVFGLLLASGWSQENISEPEQVSEADKVTEPTKEASAEVNLGDVKISDENVNKEVAEDIENTDSRVKASASASASFNFEEFLAKWLQSIQQNKEN